MKTRKPTVKIIATASLLILFVSSAVAKDIEMTGMLRSYTGARPGEGDIPLTEQTVDFSLRGWGDMSQITVNPYVYLDEEGTPEIGIREAYMDLFLTSLDIRVGQQAIVWGEAEGAFITDIVSPQDLRSFILADFSEVRMGVPALKADYYAGPFTFEAVWLPRFVANRLPETDSIWYADEMTNLSAANLPGDSLENSEIFGKVSYFGAALNAELMAGYAWDDQPVLSGAAPSPDALHKRYTVVGGSFSTTVGSAVLRSEAAAYLQKDFTGVAGPGTLALYEHHQLNGLIGIDWSLIGIDMSVQYIADFIYDYNDTLLTDEFSQTGTFRLRDSYLADTLTMELFGYLGFDPYDSLLRPSVTYSIEDGVEIQTGAEIFLGDDDGKFGRYSDNSLVYVSLRWYF